MVAFTRLGARVAFSLPDNARLDNSAKVMATLSLTEEIESVLSSSKCKGSGGRGFWKALQTCDDEFRLHLCDCGCAGGHTSCPAGLRCPQVSTNMPQESAYSVW